MNYKNAKKGVPVQSLRLSTLTKGLMIATCVMQSSSDELSTLVSGKAKI